MNIKKREIFTKEMTQEQIDRAIELLQIAINDGKVEVVEPLNKKINLINETCYISSGQYIGLFFPNLSLQVNNREIVCVSFGGTSFDEYNYDLIIIRKAAREELGEFEEDLYNLVYSYEERMFYAECKRLKNEYHIEIERLKKVKLIKTSKGEDFKVFSKNFEGVKVNKTQIYKNIFEINVGSYSYRNEGDPSVDDVMEKISQVIDFDLKKINDLSNLESHYHQVFKKIEKFAKEIVNFCNDNADGYLTSYRIKAILGDRVR